MPEETLGDWLDATTLRARLPEMPSAELGNDLVSSSVSECVKHLESEGIEVPEDGDVPADYRMAQLLFARTLLAARATNGDQEAAGMDAQIPLYSWRKRARDLLGYKTLGIG
jgi:hypothetical protein